MGGGSEAAFLWDQLLDGVLNGPARPRRAVSVEDGHMIALPDQATLADAAKPVTLASPAPSGDLADSVAAIATLDLTANGAAVPGLAAPDGGSGDSPGSAGDRGSVEAAAPSSSGGYVQVSFASWLPPRLSASMLIGLQMRLCRPKTDGNPWDMMPPKEGLNQSRLFGTCALEEHRVGRAQVAAKQMVGVYLSVWVRAALLPAVRGVQVTSVGTGIMGYLGNKGGQLQPFPALCLPHIFCLTCAIASGL